MTATINSLNSHQYWESLRTKGFCLPQCQACKEFHFYLRPACPACGGAEIEPVVVSGRGQLYSFSVVYRAPSANFEKDVPYVVAIVATDEGPHLMTRLVGVKPEDVVIGMRVSVKDWRTSNLPAEHPSIGQAPPLFERATP